MPSFRQVAFAGTPTVSRQPHPDELRAIHKFAGHASRCAKCAHPWNAHINGSTLCDRGHHYAQNVAVYVYNKAGKAYSRDDGYAPTQIEIPVGCEAVRELLEAMEHGLRIRKPPVITYDRTYPIPSRIAAPQHLPSQQVIEVIPRRSHHHSRHVVSRHSEKPYVAGRGSLYASDMSDRHRRYLADSSFYPSTSNSGRYSSRGDMVLNDSRRFYP